jgi:hypothetical protein
VFDVHEHESKQTIRQKARLKCYMATEDY